MPNSETFENIKIPYPSEGVIRTAAIDDTLTPENSVQIGVNVNFDRIGAIQTRKGLTEYADNLTGEIKNFGTLNNTIIPRGFSSIVKLGETDTFDSGTTIDNITSASIDDTHIILFWQAVDGHGFTQVVQIDDELGGFIMKGSPLEFDTTNGGENACIKIDATHFLNVWQGASGDGFAQIFSVNTTTWAVTAVGSAFEFDTADASFISVAMIDANHVLVCYTSAANIGVAVVLAINLSTWAVTKPGSPTTYDGTRAYYNSCASLGDGSHFTVAWSDNDNDGKVQAMSINLSTWAITMLSSPLEFDAVDAAYINLLPVDNTQRFILFWSGPSQVGLAQVVSTNLSTFAITTVGIPLTFESTNVVYIGVTSAGDGEHFIAFWLKEGVDDIGQGQIFDVNQSTFAVAAVRQPISLGAAYIAMRNNPVYMSTGIVVNFWKNPAQNGVGSVFRLDDDPVYGNWLYAQQGDADVLNWDNPGWVVRRSSVNPQQKARFTQYLNYIWMVNGNASFGDPVQTSSGGAFGNDLVPDNFPPGDFIQAGFEGRVWVGDALLDILYYTDIVQFTPPDIYSLTYNPETNFIKNFSPQNGQKMTALMITPRALLLFKQDSIFRIYGATSIDAYPAYNVGTYSQESIIQTKDGLYFHHSSGFYKFAYDSQPVEISRRVIDFVQAIPRSYYEDVVGIYDGFDAVEWSVGPVTVEGVTYSNCVMRYTISTQVWTIYDYPQNDITAFIYFDDGTNLNMIMGTDVGKVSKMDDGFTDLGNSIYFEIINRWRSFTEMYAKIKSISGFNVYTENAGGVKFQYQIQDASPNQWEDIGTITEVKNTLFPNEETEDFNVVRLRFTGNTKGEQIVFHGIELLKVDDKGFSKN